MGKTLNILGIFQGDMSTNALTILKSYATKALMDADVSPTYEIDGVVYDILFGQLVSVTDDNTNNGVYRKSEAGWEYAGTLGDTTNSAILAMNSAIEAKNITVANSILLGGIAYNASAPTPGKSGYYEFISAGTSPAWLSGSSGSVSIGDRVIVVFTSPSTYTYTFQGNPNTNSDIYNVTVRIPLSAGSYYTAASARSAVSAAMRKSGFVLRYLTATAEVDALNVTSGASSSANVTITLNRVAFVVAITSGAGIGDTATLVAAQIRAASYTGWTTGGTGTQVTWTKAAIGTCSTPVWSAGTTGISASIFAATLGKPEAWITEEFIANSTTNWTTATNWKVYAKNGTYNVTAEHPLVSGNYYTLYYAVRAIRDLAPSMKELGKTIKFTPDGTTWREYTYVGTATDDTSWVNMANWTNVDLVRSMKQLGLQNPSTFFIEEDNYRIASSLLKITVVVDDSIIDASDIRLYGVFNGSSNPSTTLIVKDATTGKIATLTRSANTGIVSLSGSDSTNMMFVFATLDLDKIPYTGNFIWSQSTLANQAKLTPVKKSEYWPLNATGINRFAGKKILWLGTSIPAQGISSSDSYPQLIASMLGATVYNEALGNSCLRATRYDGSLKGMYYLPALSSLSQTVAEKQSILDHWTSGLDSNGNITEGGTYGWKDLLLGTPPASYTSIDTAANILSWSYEKKIVAKYLNTSDPSFIAQPDIIVFDHGHNDLVVDSYDDNESNAIAVPNPVNSRARFIGAFNYLKEIINSYMPRAEIVFVGHYENDRKTRIYQAQQNLAGYHNMPLFKFWEVSGINQKQITTTGFWTNNTTWNNSGGASQQITNSYLWMYDDLHPASLPARQMFAKKICGWLKTI